MFDCGFPFRVYVEVSATIGQTGSVIRVAALTCFGCGREDATQCVIVEL